MWIVRRSTAARPEGVPDVSGRTSNPGTIGTEPKWATRRITSPSTRWMRASAAPHSCDALSATAASTGWTSVGEEEITRRISAVAVCCSSDSVSSRVRSSTRCSSVA